MRVVGKKTLSSNYQLSLPVAHYGDPKQAPRARRATRRLASTSSNKQNAPARYRWACRASPVANALKLVTENFMMQACATAPQGRGWLLNFCSAAATTARHGNLRRVHHDFVWPVPGGSSVQPLLVADSVTNEGTNETADRKTYNRKGDGRDLRLAVDLLGS